MGNANGVGRRGLKDTVKWRNKNKMASFDQR